MTENEAKEWIRYLGNQNLPYDRSPKSRKLACDIAIQALSEIQQYRAIGTIEEFKALKEKNETLKTLYEDARKEGNNLLARERNKAIDEFAETLKEKYEEHNFGLCLRQNDYYSYSNSCMLFENYIDKIAEQLKAGGKDD